MSIGDQVSISGFGLIKRNQIYLRRRLMLKYFLLLCFCCSCLTGFTQNDKKYFIHHVPNGHIRIDGNLDEPEWLDAQYADSFLVSVPIDTGFAKSETYVRLLADENNIYLSAVCVDDVSGNFVITSLKRDFSYPASDGFGFFIDPFGDQTNGFAFTVNPFGVQREGLLANGGNFGVSTDWDGVWYSAVQINEGAWVVEMQIPLKTIRFKPGATQWRVNFSRNDLKRNEGSSWMRVPRNNNIATLAFTGELIWDRPPETQGLSGAIIPYGLTNLNRDFTTQSKYIFGSNVGLDAKLSLTSSLNLDITINPDFSQVEVDRQVTNLTRFSIFYPEKRNFFIENSDLFAQFGFTKIRPFFSRQIGLSGSNVIPILGGLRLSGKPDKNWRIGIMTVQTDKSTKFSVLSQNYTVAAAQRQIFSRSNIGFIFVNRQAMRHGEIISNDFNRVGGIDYNLASKNNRWIGKIFFHHSFTPVKMKEQNAQAVFLVYANSHFHAEYNHEYVGKNYIADIGFIPRQSFYNPFLMLTERRTYWRLEPSISWKFFPSSKTILSHGPALNNSIYYDNALHYNDQSWRLGYNFTFQSTAKIDFYAEQDFVRLPFPVNLTGDKNLPLPASEYAFYSFKVEFNSNGRKPFNFYLSAENGKFFLGEKFSAAAAVNLRVQPWGVFTVSASRDYVHFPEPYGTSELWLVGPKAELSLTKSFFFTVFTQYNTQIENVNVNARLQWRFKPLSDFYIVYTDNYDSGNYGVKNRALVAKLICWFTV